jgi:hypothetical protein
MQKPQGHFRSPETIVADNLYPRDSPLPGEQCCDRRHQAIAEVLARLPEDAYQRLARRKASKRSFDWFVPEAGVFGLVFPLDVNFRTKKGRLQRLGQTWLRPHSRIIYLSPYLELRGWDCLVYVVAHELAHISLNHAPETGGDEDAERSEREAFHRACAWGFRREAKKIEELKKKAEETLTNPADLRLPAAVAELKALAWTAGIHVGNCYPEGEITCIEFFSSGDAELFLKIARKEYTVTAEVYNDGNMDDVSPRVVLLVRVPTADLAHMQKHLGNFIEN